MGLLDYLRGLSHRTPTSQSSSSSLVKGYTEVRILFLGLDNAGKTTIFKRLCDEDLMSIRPTTGFQIKQINKGGLQVVLWDVGGQKSIRPYWNNYFDATDAIIYVIDSTDRRRLDETGVELQLLFENEKLMGVPFLLFANKQDLLHSLSPQEITQGLNLYTQRDRVWQIFPCSAKLATGLEDGMEFIMNEIRENRAKRDLGLV